MSEQNENVGPGASEPEAGAVGGDGDALVSRLRLIEDQPLAGRAEAYAHLHDELREALDAADRQRSL